MQTNATRVWEFHDAVGATPPESPTVPPPRTLELRRTLIVEEYEEVMEAFDRLHASRQNGAAISPMLLAELAQELADLLYVTYGGFVDCGLDADAIFAEVHRANLQKARGPKRPDGKSLKPTDWTPPNVAGLIS